MLRSVSFFSDSGRRVIVLTVVAVAVVATGVAAERSMPQPYLVGDWLPDLFVGMALAGAGLLACGLGRSPRMGTLLVLGSAAWFLPNFALVWPGWLGAIAAGSVFLHRGFLLHAVAAAPTGRARTRPLLVVIPVIYAASVSPAAWNNDAVAVALGAAVLVLVYLGYRGAAGSQRKARLAALVAASVFAVLITGEILVRATVTNPPDALLLNAYQLGMVTVAGILAGGLVLSGPSVDEVTDLVVELVGARSATLRARLAWALGDPSLQVGYWIAEEERYVDAAGLAVDVREGPTRAVTRVDRGETPVAVLVHDPALLADEAVVTAVAGAARLNAANVVLRAELRARVAEAQESRRRIVDADTEERRRLELRVKDGVLGRLDHVSHLLEMAWMSDGDVDRPALDRAKKGVALAREDLLNLARGIYPGRLSEQGLTATLQSLSAGVPVRVTVDAESGILSDAGAACVWFVCAESLANAIKYAAANRVDVSVQRELDRVVVRVADDGVGGADVSKGSGLRGLADRVEALGGTLSVESPPGAGTVIVAQLPVPGRG